MPLATVRGMRHTKISWSIALAIASLSLSARAGTVEEGTAETDFSPEPLSRLLRLVTVYESAGERILRRELTREEQQSCCPDCVTDDGEHFYDSLRTMSRQVVAACAASVPEGSEVVVSRTDRPHCYVNRVHYSLRKEADGVHVGLRVRLDPSYVGLQREREMLESARRCVPLIRNAWAVGGVQLDLSFDSTNFQSHQAPHGTVALDPGEGRSSATLFYYGGFNLTACLSGQFGWVGDLRKQEAECEARRHGEFCLLLLHETGHHLGLVDEYADAHCPSQEERPPPRDDPRFPTSPMYFQWKGWGYIGFYPDHFERVVAPLCPGRA